PRGDPPPAPLSTKKTLWGTVTYASALDRERAISVFDNWDWRGYRLAVMPLEDVVNDSNLGACGVGLLSGGNGNGGGFGMGVGSGSVGSRPSTSYSMDHNGSLSLGIAPRSVGVDSPPSTSS